MAVHINLHKHASFLSSMESIFSIYQITIFYLCFFIHYTSLSADWQPEDSLFTQEAIARRQAVQAPQNAGAGIFVSVKQKRDARTIRTHTPAAIMTADKTDFLIYIKTHPL